MNLVKHRPRQLVDVQLNYRVMEMIVMIHLKPRWYQQHVKVHHQIKKIHRQQSIGGLLRQQLINNYRQVNRLHHLYHVLLYHALLRLRLVIRPHPPRTMMIRLEDRIKLGRMERILCHRLLHRKVFEQSHLMNMHLQRKEHVLVLQRAIVVLHRMWMNHAMVVHVVHIVNTNMNQVNVHVRQHLKNDHQTVEQVVVVIVVQLVGQIK